MSDKEWYEGLSMGELPGKHVHVVFSNATMDGCLNLHGEIPYWAEDDDLKYVQVLERGHDQVWRTAVGVESVSLVWDERDWEQIRTEDISKADAVVVNGRLIRVNGLFSSHQFRPVDGGGCQCLSSMSRVLCVAGASCRPTRGITGTILGLCLN